MEHILDKPIWNALNSGNKSFSIGNEQAKKFIKEVASFAGMKENSPEDFSALHDLSDCNNPVILFSVGKLSIPENWEVIVTKELLQMVYEGGETAGIENTGLVSLESKDVPAMLDLTARTNPGPFLSRTIEFGNYEGIFDGTQLVSMAGRRLQPTPYVEISAVCTHPDYLGRGYAGKIIQSLVRKIVSESMIPFLHVVPENLGAISVYEKSGFQVRKEMRFYVLEKK